MTRRPAGLELSREQILAFRRATGVVDTRLPTGPESLRRAAWAGLTDSMPRAALLSIHARIEGTRPEAWEAPSLVQVWGPRFNAYVVAAEDRAVFTLGRLPEAGAGLRRAETIADDLERVLAGRRLDARDPGRALGLNPNMFRYAMATGRFLIRWDGARQPTIWAVPAPDVEPQAARHELARRYLHVLGPGTAQGFGSWAGVKPARATRTFEELVAELVPVRTPVGDAWILAADEPAFRAVAGDPASARLLPSGDAFWLYHGRDRELLVPEAGRRAELWTPRVWPGAVLVDGEVAGTWRRADADLSIEPWRGLSPAERAAVEAEAVSLPLPGLEGGIRVRWPA